MNGSSTSCKSPIRNGKTSINDFASPVSVTSSSKKNTPSHHHRLETNSITNSVQSTNNVVIHPNDWNYSCKLDSSSKPLNASHRKQRKTSIEQSNTAIWSESDLYIPLSRRKYSLSIVDGDGINRSKQTTSSIIQPLPALFSPSLKISLPSDSLKQAPFDASHMNNHRSINDVTHRIDSFFKSHGYDNSQGGPNSLDSNYEAKSVLLLSANQISTQNSNKTRHQSLLGPYNYMVDEDLSRCLLRNEDMTIKDLRTVSLQLKLLHLVLQKKSAADQQKEEEDLLLAWQLVRNAEHSVRLLSRGVLPTTIHEQSDEEKELLKRLTNMVSK